MAGEKENPVESSLPQEMIDAVNRAAERERGESERAAEAQQPEPQGSEPQKADDLQETQTGDVERAADATAAKVPDPEQDTALADVQSGDAEAAPTITPELAEVARQYGLRDEDVAEFQSVDELKRAMRLLDREAARLLTPQKALQSPPERPKSAGVPPAGEGAKPPADKVPEKPVLTIDQQIQALREKGWDEDILALHKQTLEQNAALAQQVQYMDGYLRHRSQAEQQYREQAVARSRQAHLSSVLSGIDALNRQDLFGQSDKAPTDEQTRNLGVMREAVETLQALQHRRGLNPALTSELVQRAFEISFSKQLQHEAAKDKAKAVIQQSKTVMGQGRKPSVPAKSIPYDESQPLSEHPRIKEYFAKIHAETA